MVLQVVLWWNDVSSKNHHYWCGLHDFLGASCSSSVFSGPAVSMTTSLVLRDANNFRVNTAFGGSLTVVDVVTDLVDFFAVCEVSLRDSPSASLYFPEVVILGCWLQFTIPLCSACALTFRMAFSSFSVTMYMPQSALKSGFPARPLQKFASFSLALFRIVVHSELSLTSASMHSARISMSLSTLYTFCTTEAASGHLFVMSWHWDFSDASFYVQYFWNPNTGSSAILVYTQVHRWFGCFTQHCAHHGQVANFNDTTFGKRELAVSTLCKVFKNNSVQHMFHSNH
jgi:hypothetical protein